MASNTKESAGTFAVITFGILVAACAGEHSRENADGSGSGGGATAVAGMGGSSGLGSAGGGAAGSLGGSGAGSHGGSSGSASEAGASGGGAGGASASGTAGASGASGAGGTSGASGTAGASGTSGGRGGSGSGLASFRLVVLGSSSAAGEGASNSSQGWVSLLSSALEDVVTTEWSLRNLARGGYTTSELLPSSGADGNIDDALELEPNLVIVALAGSNDLSAGTSENVFLSRLATLRETARAAGVPLFFLSTAPKDLGTSERQVLRDWAEAMELSFSSCWAPGRDDEYSPCFVDIFEPLANSSLGIEAAYNAGDGIHLNDAGHRVIFEAARDVATAYVCSMTTCNVP